MLTNPSALAREFVAHGRLESLPIIDTHAHMGAVYGASLREYDARAMVAVMDREHIGMVFCAPHSALFDPAMGNRDLEEAMAAYPDRIRGYFSVNPNYPPRLSDLERVLTHPGYIGFKLLPEYHRTALDGDAYREVLSFAARYRRVVLAHTWGGSPYNAPGNAARVLKRHPELTLILGHSAPGECGRAIALAREYPNAYLDLCDIHRHSGILERMVEGAGAGKVLFGTDIPWYDPHYCLGSILFSTVGDEEKALIISGNARRILAGLTEGAGHGVL